MNKVYYCSDFKCTKNISYTNRVGYFDDGIYAICIYTFGGSMGNGFSSFYKITRQEYEAYPENARFLEEQAQHSRYLTSEWANVSSFTRQDYDNIKI